MDRMVQCAGSTVLTWAVLSAASWERLYSIEVIFSTAHLVYSILYSVNSAVERYTAPSHPTTPLQSYTAYTALYSVIQHIQRAVYYTAIQLIHYTALYNHPLCWAISSWSTLPAPFSTSTHARITSNSYQVPFRKHGVLSKLSNIV